MILVVNIESNSRAHRMDSSVLRHPDYNATLEEVRHTIERLITMSFHAEDTDTPEFLRQMQANAYILAYLDDALAVAYSVIKNNLDPVQASIAYLVSICVI